MLFYKEITAVFVIFTAASIQAAQPGATIRHFEIDHGDRVLTAQIDFALPPSAVWNVLTDYENAETFMPGVEESHLLPPLPSGEKRLEQHTVQGVLFFKRHLRMVLRLSEAPPHRIAFSLIEGDFKTYEGVWNIDTTATPAHLQLDLRVQPGFFAPGPILDHVVQTSALQSLEAVIREARRRAQQTPP